MASKCKRVMIDTSRIMTEETNTPKPPEGNVDLELAFAISEAASVLENYVKQQIGEPAFWAYRDAQRRGDDVPEVMQADKKQQFRDMVDAKGARAGLDFLDEGLDVASAIAYGNIVGQYSALDEDEEFAGSDPYMDAWVEIQDQFVTAFDLNAQGEFSLVSVDNGALRINLPPVLEVITEVVYRPVGMDIKTEAYYLREVPNVYGPFAMELKRIDIDLEGEDSIGQIGIAQLQKDVLAVLKETTADLKTAA